MTIFKNNIILQDAHPYFPLCNRISSAAHGGINPFRRNQYETLHSAFVAKYLQFLLQRNNLRLREGEEGIGGGDGNLGRICVEHDKYSVAKCVKMIEKVKTIVLLTSAQEALHFSIRRVLYKGYG